MLGKLIAGYRKANGLTLKQLSEQSGVSLMALWRIEQGRHDTSKQWPAILRWVFGK